MSNVDSHKFEGKSTWMRLLPYAALGIVVFSLNSASDLNYFLKGYLVLLEAQAGIVLIYFLMSKLARSKKR
ncbi:hypothetical protein PN499_02960 [Kamptonema animale CS-326]|jgi:hypothetical protein|uniref:hypothetical protein n=1 Tax=Kamptonema animale TaxID=92934 RepID=UPI00232BFDEE|nr:hypothetical protein [Kamptonema animale]MDB9510169.1 hypothetical protein [Kamptonema animale CS-326]